MVNEQDKLDYLNGCQSQKDWAEWVDTKANELLSTHYKVGTAVKYKDGTTAIVVELARSATRRVPVARLRFEGQRGKARMFSCEELLNDFEIIKQGE
jgi:hypothetical protein